MRLCDTACQQARSCYRTLAQSTPVTSPQVAALSTATSTTYQEDPYDLNICKGLLVFSRQKKRTSSKNDHSIGIVIPLHLCYHCTNATIIKLQLLRRDKIIIDDHDYTSLAQNLSTFRRTMWKEAMLSTIASSSDFDISAIQFATLFLLAGEGELTIKSVAELIGRSVSATSRMLDQLVIRGLVSRNEDTRDRRTKRVSLSENGQAFVQVLEQKRAEAQIVVMAYLSPEERGIVEQAMQLLAAAARRHAHEQ